MKRRLLLFTGCLLPAVLSADPVTTLYDPLRIAPLIETLDQQGWFAAASIFGNQTYFFSAGAGVTLFDSFPIQEAGAWTTIGAFTGNVLHPQSQIHDSDLGFTLSFDLALDEENHDLAVDIDGDGLADEAGFSILILDKATRGVGLNFWEDRIWASSDEYVSDSAPLAQAEGVAQVPAEMATMRSYALTVMRGSYRLTIDGATVLEGPTRSYDFFSFTVNPFNKPNIINMGDASFTAGARARIGAVTIETCFTPESPPNLEVSRGGGGVSLEWDCVPGATYLVQAGNTLDGWTDLRSFVATTFSASYFELIDSDTPRRFYRVQETLP